MLLSRSPKTEKTFYVITFENRARCFFSFCHEHGIKKNLRVSSRNPRSDALPLSHRDSTVSGVYYEVHTTSVCLKVVLPLMKTLSMSRSLIPEVRHKFHFLSFFISYLSGNKIRYLPQGIFKGLKQLLIV